jgi:uncharacterized membrane protein
MALGVAARTECASGAWWQQEQQFTNLCYSDIPHQYVGLGLAEQVGPLDDGDGRWPDPGVTAPTAVVTYAAARISQAAFGVVDPVDRNDATTTAVAADATVQQEAVKFTAVAAVLLALAALVATALLAATHRSRPWDAMGFAAAPVLALSGLIGWDLLAVVCVAGAMWAHSRARPWLAGVFVGAGAAFALWPAAVLVAVVLMSVRAGRAAASVPLCGAAVLTWLALNLPAYVARPDGWASYWQAAIDDAPGLGSLWKVPAAFGLDADATLANQVHVLGAVVGICAVVWVAMSAPRPARLPQLALLSLVALLLFSKAVPVQASLWLLPFAVLARPRWRDLLIWQACEAVYFLATWWYLGGSTQDNGDQDVVYPVALVVRTAGILWLAAIVVRDIRRPQHDAVRGEPPAVALGRGRPAAVS